MAVLDFSVDFIYSLTKPIVMNELNYPAV